MPIYHQGDILSDKVKEIEHIVCANSGAYPFGHNLDMANRNPIKEKFKSNPENLSQIEKSLWKLAQP